MPLDKPRALSDIDSVLSHSPGYGGEGAAAEVAVMMKACVERWAPPGSSYRSMAGHIDPFGNRPSRAALFPEVAMKAVLTTLRRDIDKDMLRTFEEEIHVAIFDDLLLEARHLLDGNHLLAAAVVVGAAHEEHIRKLASKFGVAVTKDGEPRKMPGINDDLKNAQAYTQPEWRQRQVWFDIRNEAAHNLPGFQGRTPQDLRRMLDDVRDFIARHPA